MRLDREAREGEGCEPLMPAPRLETGRGTRPRPGCILLLLFATCSPAAALDATLPESFSAPGNNLVQMRRIGTSPAPTETATDVKEYLNVAVTTDSRYTVALKNVDHFGANQYLAYEFLVWRNSGPRETTRVLFNVTATGSFADFFKTVPFTVTDGADTASGEVDIPVHSLDPPAQCRVVDAPTRTEPLPVFLSGDTDYTLSLDCGAAASLPRLVSLRGPVAGHRQYWERIVFESEYWGPNGPTNAVKTRSFDLLKATVTPNVLAAVGARFRRLNVKDSPDDTIVFDLAYAIPPGGFEIPLKVEIPVVFFPFIWVIAGALWSGVGVGWAAAWLLLLIGGRSKPGSVVAGALLLGLLLAVVAFAVALLAYSANCRLQVFGLDLNPSDVVVLFLLGLACGGIALLKVEELPEADQPGGAERHEARRRGPRGPRGPARRVVVRARERGRGSPRPGRPVGLSRRRRDRPAQERHRHPVLRRLPRDLETRRPPFVPPRRHRADLRDPRREGDGVRRGGGGAAHPGGPHGRGHRPLA